MDASPEESLPEYNLAEVMKHGTPDNLWMIIYNKVYDVTSFLNKHPGGAEVLFDCGGVDATEAFEDVGHSKNAFDMLVPYLIGQLPKNDAKLYKTAELGKETNVVKEKSKLIDKHAHTGEYSVRVLAILALLACIVIICLQKLKWANIIS